MLLTMVKLALILKIPFREVRRGGVSVAVYYSYDPTVVISVGDLSPSSVLSLLTIVVSLDIGKRTSPEAKL